MVLDFFCTKARLQLPPPPPMKSRRRRESDNGNTLFVRISGGWQTIMASLLINRPISWAASVSERTCRPMKLVHEGPRIFLHQGEAAAEARNLFGARKRQRQHIVRISGRCQTIMASLVKVSVPGDYSAIDQSDELFLFQRGRAGL
jgi:hypothetical protein